MLIVGMFAPVVGQAAGFKDVSSNYRFYDEILYLSEEGVISGFKDGSFNPDSVVTRAQAAIMIGRALDLNGDPKNTRFKDVPSTVTGSGYIASAVEKGIITGFSDDTYRPSDPVTRGQMAIFLNRAFILTHSLTNTYKDVSPNMKAYQSILNVYASGITNGYTDDTYRPDLAVTRGQFSAFMARALEPSFRSLPALTIESISEWERDSSIIEVDIDKEWVIHFNDELDSRSLYDNIYVVRERDNERINITEPWDDKKSVKLRLGELYDFNETYYLYITKDVKSINGTHLAEPLKLKFQTRESEFNVKKTIEQDGIQFEIMIDQSDEKVYTKVKATNISSETIPYISGHGCDPGMSADLFAESEAEQVKVGSKWVTVMACPQMVNQYFLDPGESIEMLEVLYPPTRPLNHNYYIKVTFKKGIIRGNSFATSVEIPIAIQEFE